ncbi:S-adenosylmethionine-dependent methyltransferase Rv2258c-like [Ptychodera flava]|uniref:S-adenosylmethionine-dependent methyltransferase Rv2258c-like n=1 Tax=Ptychodera flava TaxID=63121 RepID=UPI00396A5BDC
MADRNSEHEADFEKRFNEVAQSGYTALSVAIGSATGLFNTMAALGEAKTSQEIADAAGLKERYVREWLGAMVVASIVEADSERDTFYLPASRYRTLCTTESRGMLAILCEGLPVMCEVYKDLVECFKKEGPNGISYLKYTLDPPFIEALAMTFLGGKPPKDLTNVEQIKRLLETSSVVLDIGCGRGAPLCFMARDFLKSEFHGIDVAENCIETAKCRAESMQLKNVTFHIGDALESVERQDWRSKFDIVYCRDVVHDMQRPDLFLKGVKNVLKDEGYFVMVEITAHGKPAKNMDCPVAPHMYAASLFRCLPMSLAGNGESMALGAMRGNERALEMLAEVGLKCFLSEKADTLNTAYYCKKN